MQELGSGGCLISWDGVMVPAAYTQHYEISVSTFGVDVWSLVSMGGIRISISEDSILITVDLSTVTIQAVTEFMKYRSALRQLDLETTTEFENISIDSSEFKDRIFTSSWKRHGQRIAHIKRVAQLRAA